MPAMSSTIHDNYNLQPRLPSDLFQHIILPDLLSLHLHALLVDSESPKWHAFYILPLVSREWYQTCQSLFSGIFGKRRRSDETCTNEIWSDENPDDFDDQVDHHPSLLLDYAMSVWRRSRHPASKTAFSHQYSQSTLLEDKSLVRVYTCLALGKMFLNEDVLLPLGVYAPHAQDAVSADHVHRTAWDEDYEEETDIQVEQTSMDEASIHRSLIPFGCAQQLCDCIVPERLAYVVARYMAQILPLYHILPRLTKYARDLQFNVDRNYMIDLESYTSWTTRTLSRLETAEDLLDDMMSYGVLVRSYWNESGIPAEAFKLAGIIGALDDVVRVDWGADTLGMRKRASALIRRWAAAA